MKAHGTPTDTFTLLMCVRCFKDSLRSAQHIINGPQDFPDNPKQLKDNNPAVYLSAYSDDSPVEAPISWQDVEMQSSVTPCRSRTGRLSDTPVASQALSGWSRIPRKNFGNILSAACSNQHQIVLPPIDITGNNRSKSFDAAACHHVYPFPAIGWMPPCGEPQLPPDETQPTVGTQVQPHATQQHGGQSPPTHTDGSSKNSESPEEKLKKLTENTQRLASEDAAKKLQATATTTAKKNAPSPKAKAKGKAGTKKAKAKAKGKSATIKTVNESDSKMSAKKTPGCSKCRYLQNGCKACNPKRFK